MGKHAQYAKRGTARQQGNVAAMGNADWSLGAVTATTQVVNLLAAFPPNADRWGVLVVNAATGVVAFSTFQLATPITATGLVTATTYRVQVAWFQSPGFQRVSDWSPARTFTTP